MADFFNFDELLKALGDNSENEEDKKNNFRKDDEIESEEIEKEIGKLFEDIFDVRGIGKMLEESRKAEEKKKAALNTLLETIEEMKKMVDKQFKVSIDADEIAELEAKNPEFAEATKEGFSEEEIRKIIVEVADYFIKNLDLKRFKDSYVISILKGFGKEFNFSDLTGENVYKYLKEAGHIDQLQAPEVKKKCIFTDAVKAVVKAKTISFNNAVRKTVARYNNSFDEVMKIKDNPEVLGIINKLIELYLENEVEIVDTVLKKIGF